MSEICAACGKKIHLFKIKIKDGFICGVCQDKLPLNDYMKKEEYDGEQIREIIRLGEERDNAKPDLLQAAIIKANANIKNKNDPDKFDEISKYKKLLDEGIITEEEYEKKKKELLGL